MIKEAIEKIQALCAPHIVEIGGEQYAINSDGSHALHIRPELDYAAEIFLHSLDALVQMVKTEALSYPAPVYIEASGYDTVSCFLQPNSFLQYIRQMLYTVTAKDVPGWNEGDNLPFEQALIAVRTRFQQSNDTEYLLKLLSEISNGAKVTYADNGVATTVVTQKGIALQGSEAIRPIVTLKPYRTFQEIEQPASEFHIRIGERGIRFIEADGGMWKLAARRTIVEYLKEHLSDAVEDGRVVVMI